MIITFESRKKSFPAYLLLISYAAIALAFSDRWQYLAGMGLALVFFLGSYGLGKRLSFLVFKTADQTLFFPLGLGMVLVISYVAASYAATSLLFYSIWIALAALSAFEIPILTYRFSRSYAWGAPFVLFAFWSALTPTTFTDALAYSIGIPQQYLAAGKIAVSPHLFYTSFPPFGQVLQMLFAAMNSESGIKAFTVLIYFQIISLLVSLLRWLITEPVIGAANEVDHEYQTDLLYMTRTELLVIPMLLFPSALILIHASTYDILVSLFFCAGIASLVKEFDLLSYRKIFHVATLLAFALWTKYNVSLFIFPLFILWYALSRWRVSREGKKMLISLYGLILLLWLPMLVRNLVALGDPFYPALAGILNVPSWSPSQALALERATMRTATGWTDVLLTPALLTVQPSWFGLGAQIGLVFLFSLLVYPFAKKLRTVNQVLVYVLACYLMWVFTLQQFREFLPAFFFLYLMSYFAFRHIHIRYPRHIWICWIVCIAAAIFYVFPVFLQHPLILPNLTQQQYLRGTLDYYPIAETINVDDRRGRVLLLGETRLAHFDKPVIAATAYDQMPFRQEMHQTDSAAKLHELMMREGIHYVVYNGEAFDQLYLKSSAKVQVGPWKEFLSEYAQVEQNSGNVVLYEVRDADAW